MTAAYIIQPGYFLLRRSFFCYSEVITRIAQQNAGAEFVQSSVYFSQTRSPIKIKQKMVLQRPKYNAFYIKGLDTAAFIYR